MEGLLVKYGSASANVAFISPGQPPPARKHCIMIGGLTDGLLATPYVRRLAVQLESMDWSLVQPLLSSSFQQWGISSLDSDASELHQLAAYLKQEHGSQGIVLIGHSTGCQDSIRYAQRLGSSTDAAPLLGVVLQAPVSDREYMATQPGTAERLARAQAMLAEGRGEEICCRADEMGGAPVTARRYHALAAPGGDDDMFSSDLTDAQLAAIYRPLAGLPALLLMSRDDEYVAPHVDQAALAARLAAAMGSSARWEVLPGGHSLEGREQEACDAICRFLSAL